MMTYRCHVLLLCLVLAGSARGSDWPMWRCDAGRTASSAENLPAELHLLWERRYTPRNMVWDDPLNRDLMPYDRVFEPVVMGKRMFVGFNDCDKLVALDTESGEELWAFYTAGPVRFPAVAWKQKVYFAGDDGYLYCVDAASGRLVWKFRGGPSEEKIIGNRRLISTWPARGGPVLRDDTVYFAAGIWPFMGTFIYALNAETGEVAWCNDHTGSQYILQPHNSPSFAGVAPQGALAATADKLIVPGGRSVPACFDRDSGEELYFHLNAYNKEGGSFVCAASEVNFIHHREQVVSMHDLETGERLIREIGRHPVLGGEAFYICGEETIAAYDAEEIQQKARWFLAGSFWERTLGSVKRLSPEPDPGLMNKLSFLVGRFIGGYFRKWTREKDRQWRESLLWEIQVDGGRDLIKAGNRLYAAGSAGITAIELPRSGGRKPEVAWSKPVEGEVFRLLAADGKLFAVTLDGRIMAFGSGKAAPGLIPRRIVSANPSARAVLEARRILADTGAKEGYALVYGVEDSDLLEALALNSELEIIAVHPDSAHVEKLRRRLDASGLYGERIAVHLADPFSFQPPPYMASLTVANDPQAFRRGGKQEEFLERICRSMRPYDGKAWLPLTLTSRLRLINRYGAKLSPEFRIRPAGEALLLTREGPLPGAAPWTHQYGDPANTVKSDDSLVKLPLGILWFGGSSNLDVLPRHGHGPPEQVVGGRLFIEGIDCLSARDVYTGRVLWKTTIEGLNNYGVYYDGSYREDTPTSTAYNQQHIPGANIRGTNYVATADRVYVAQDGGCTVLDAATGKIVMNISLPCEGDPDKPQWGYIGVYGDYLIAGSGLVKFSVLSRPEEGREKELADLAPHRRESKLSFTNFDKSASKRLVIMDRHSGKTLWSREAGYGFLHNAVAVAAGRIFCLDKLPPHIENQLRRRGRAVPAADYSLLALDLHTGDILWQRRENVFGSWLGYSAEHDVLLQSTRPSRDMVQGETGSRMVVYGAGDGTVLWDRAVTYGSVPILHGERIITQGKIISLLSGEPQYMEHPLTGERVLRTWRRNYGCNYPIASENLLTFRSAAAGFYDLVKDSGTGNLGGFKSGCTSNLIAAEGVLNAPDYTRTCSCSYQNQTSLALVHNPGVEVWTFSTLERGSGPVKRVGINFGAPGDRMAGNGTLWL